MYAVRREVSCETVQVTRTVVAVSRLGTHHEAGGEVYTESTASVPVPMFTTVSSVLPESGGALITGRVQEILGESTAPGRTER